MTIFVTGGLGFIGSNFVRAYKQQNQSDTVVVFDKMTYAANIKNLDGVRYGLANHDISVRSSFMIEMIKTHSPSAIYHFAAESHVDNSINNPTLFAHNNVIGTLNLLEAIRETDKGIRFINVSTDEVFGSLSDYDPPFNENTPYNPRSPYSASKASADHFVKAYHTTYGLDTITTNCSNNYGPYQHIEKFIPTVIRKAMNNESVPVYGNGKNIRDWIHVSDHCQGILAAAEKGISGEQYLFGGNTQLTNIDLAKRILDIMNKPHSLIQYVEDRKGHDHRYDIDNSKSNRELNWEPKTLFTNGIESTVNWYLENTEWIKSCQKP